MKPVFIAMAAMLALAGCGTMSQQIQTVKVPVSVPCKITPPERPSFAVDSLDINAGIWEQMTALRAERVQRIGYETTLEAVIRGCQ